MTPEELKEHPTISFREPYTSDIWNFRKEDRMTEVRITPNLTTNSFWVARDACLKGVGIARLPSALCSMDVQQGKLIPILTDWDTSQGPVYAVFPSRKLLGSHIRTFLEMLERFLNVPKEAYTSTPLVGPAPGHLLVPEIGPPYNNK